MRLVEVLRESEHAAHEIRADLNCRLADAARESGRFVHDQKAQAGILPQQQRRRGRAGERAADHNNIVGGRRV